MNKEIIKKQILTIRDTGATNMFDTRAVKELAEMLEFEELIEYLETNKKQYCEFIMYGKGL